jgi:galactokinase
MRRAEHLHVAASAGPYPEADDFCDRARRHSLFGADRPVVVARAPGRFDVLGGIADYSGAVVLQLPIASAAMAAVQVAHDGRVVAVSGSRSITVPSTDLLEAPLEDLARRFAGGDAWAAYVLGPVALLAREQPLALTGLRLLVSSSVPEGRGLGSSAAVEIAVLQAVAGAFECPGEPRGLALLAQRAEQRIALAPCGPMDQMIATFGKAGELLVLLCRPAEVLGSLALPPPLTLWGIDSGARHAVPGALYRRVRCASFMGKALLDCRSDYLVSLRPSDVEHERLPDWMTGAEFLRHHDGVEDDVSVVEPDVAYPVRAATLHPIEEHLRVEMFADLLRGPVTNCSAHLLGELMYASHESYSRCGLGMRATDALVDAVRAAGWERGLAGARVSGGGSGGTVVVLGDRDAEPIVRELSERLGAGLVRGSSPGAAEFGTRVLRNDG